MPILLYYSSINATHKSQADTDSLRLILKALKLEYQEIDLACEGGKEARQRMLASSNNLTKLPQLHRDDTFIGTTETVQELHDFGQLKPLLT